MQFTEENIISIFGYEAAEDEEIDKLKSYYLKGKTFEQISNDLPLRILVGHKGTGKSALLRISKEEEKENRKLSILIKPDDIIGIGDKEEDFLKLIREWKRGLIKIIAEKALTSFGLPYNSTREKINEYTGKLIEYIKSTLQESIKNYAHLEKSEELIIKNFISSNKIYVYIDDLDRGWQGQKSDIRKISALLNAVRDINSETKNISFRISLRSDVYHLVRTSDESTDKIEGNVIWLSWSNHEILALLIKRVEHFFGREHETSNLIKLDQSTLASKLYPLMSSTFYGAGHWSSIPTHRMLMTLIRKRPRDLIKLCTLAARAASEKSADIISTEHFKCIFEEYSQGRLQDTINEYRSELPEIERLLLGMKPSKQEKRTSTSYIYTTDTLLKKIENITQSGTFKFSNGKIADKQSLAAFMYKINFITARKDIGDYINRKYFEENRYLLQKFIDFGFDWEMHPAYRWALQPNDIGDIFLQMKPSSPE
ncbi:ATP-binding protein [Parachitinimonas caeni]|uniref:ATP-binding protein n=1 Tax=Parachitinimonas caeni TaxID=3031301 RepID=A0ABT7DZB0_9NEIS|nr:ATP-binding protein [Parachitinimonas caeni]MDK2125406.1 ATP-binding protein [Parachitinimonas caeni]